jgi:AcrR family transcriptional regulator
MKQSTVDLPRLRPRERILETAARLFYESGVRSVGIDRILEESGAAKASFYRYFPSKDALVEAYLRQRHERWMGWFAARLRALCAERGYALRRIADALGEWFREPDFRGCAFINATAEGSLAPASISVVQTHKMDLRREVEALAAHLGHANPQASGARALLVIEGAIIRAQMTGDAGEAENAAHLLDLLDGLQKRPRRRRGSKSLEQATALARDRGRKTVRPV